tara:strand:+ start:894 stop:1784 length:891 start_codon:yes stop_codon:yes gene_type:complete
MKKIILSLILFSTVNLFLAQEDNNETDNSTFQSKNGFNILPEKGDFAVGLSTSPIFNYLGNIFNGNTGNTSPNANFMSNPQLSTPANHLFAKYFLTDKTAVRATLEYGGTDNQNKLYVQDDAAIFADPLSNANSEDMERSISSSIILGVGYEMRRGKSRIQGYYGGNVFFMLQNSRTEYSYGNPFSELNPTPSTSDFGTNVLAGDSRILVDYNGQTMGFGIGGLFGLECFIFPKLSLGAELGYNYIYTKTGQSRYQYEEWNVNIVEEKYEVESPTSTSNSWGTLNPSANFYLMFHF